ncbi:MAG TPA: winged helix-turn-helix domain-containing protein [Nocardioides sp.]
MTDPSSPDYDLAEVLEITTPEQYRALFEDTRSRIVRLLLDRAATTSELAEVLDVPKGTVGHHLKTLERAGLVHVVRTQRVRALEAKYYGRTARVFLYQSVNDAVGEPQRALARAAEEVARVPEADAGPTVAYLRSARLPADRAEEWVHRLEGLLDDFTREPGGGDRTFTVVLGLYPSRGLPERRDP